MRETVVRAVDSGVRESPMLPRTTWRFVVMLLTGFSLSAPLLAQQQDDAPSVAEVARRARQQKQEAAKPAHVIDNDAIPPSAAASGANPAPAAPSDASSAKPAEATGGSTGPAKADANKGDEDKKKSEIEALKQQIADKLEKVNLEQREIALTQDNYFSNPDHEHDKAGKEKLDSMHEALTQFEAELADLRAKLAALNPAADEKAPETPKP